MNEWEPKFKVAQVVRLIGEKQPAKVVGYTQPAKQVIVDLPHGNGAQRMVVSESELSA